MTREEEDRRLALSTAIAKLNAAADSIGTIDRDLFSKDGRSVFDALRSHLGWVADNAADALEELKARIAAAELEDLKAKIAAETPKEDR